MHNLQTMRLPAPIAAYTLRAMPDGAMKGTTHVSGVFNWSIPIELGERRVLQPGKWRWARALGWMLVLIFAVALAFGLGLEALAQALPDEPAPQFAAHALGCLIILATYALVVRLGEDRSPTELSLTAAPFGLLAGAALGALMFSAVMAIMFAFNLYEFKFLGVAPAWKSASLALESGIFEEVLVRGIVLRLVWRAFGPWIAFTASALLFGAGHIGNPGATVFTSACVAIEAGIMLAAFYALTGRLWVSIGLHAAWNFTQGYVFGAAVSGGDFGKAMAKSTPASGFPDWLTGGAFGPEASLPALAICSAVSAVVLWSAWRGGRFTSPSSPDAQLAGALTPRPTAA